MKTKINLILAVTLTMAVFGNALAQQDADPGWPRLFKKGQQQLTLYQPQVDVWSGYTNLHFRCAVAVKGVLKSERFGVAEVDALTVTDQAARVVAIVPLKREVRFPNVTPEELTQLQQAVEQLNPPGHVTTLSLDRLLAYLDPATHPQQRTVAINLAPPKIYYSSKPAVLVIFMGEPQLKPVKTNRTDLMFALNTNWDVLYDTSSQQYYLLNGESWLTAQDAVNGPWTPAKQLPASLSSLPADDNWVEVRKQIPGKFGKKAPVVFATTEPAELILTDGDPSYNVIQGTKLLRLANSDSVVFLHTGEGTFYFLVAGRWFRAPQLSGQWTEASQDLPVDFMNIPDSDASSFVKASVPNTREAKDAVLLASIPTTTVVDVTNTPVQVVYSGPPQFTVIQGTPIQYAANSPYAVFLVDGRYYCCDKGVWFTASSANGPWSFCTSVPSAIYTIPPTHPAYNVTYVVVQSSTPSTVVYAQTSGYSGEYVATTGVLMFGAGLLVGAAIANNNSYYYPPYPSYYSYGCGASYHYGYGGYYGASYKAYGPYGGAGCSAAYNPYTGTYARSSYAYGPYGSASRSVAYNPYSGSYAANAQVNTAYGSAGRSASYSASSGQYSASSYRSSAYGTTSSQRNYNAYTGDASASRQASTAYGSASGSAAYDAQTGARAAGGQVTTAQGSAGRAAAYNPTTGQGAAAGYRSGQYGSAGAVTTTSGGSAAGWNTANSQGAVAKSSSGDVYASNGDTVYKKSSDGTWSQNSGSGWESTAKPTPQNASATATTTWQQPNSASASSATAQSRQSANTSTGNYSRESAQNMNAQAQSRSYGNQQAARTRGYQSSGGSRGGRR